MPSLKSFSICSIETPHLLHFQQLHRDQFPANGSVSEIKFNPLREGFQRWGVTNLFLMGPQYLIDVILNHTLLMNSDS